MQVLHSQQNLVHEISGLGFGNSFATFVQFHQWSSSAQLQDNVDKIGVFEKSKQFNDILMTECLVERNFLSHFLPLMLFNQQGFGHDFTSGDFIVIEIAQFIAFSKTTLQRKRIDFKIDKWTRRIRIYLAQKTTPFVTGVSFWRISDDFWNVCLHFSWFIRHCSSDELTKILSHKILALSEQIRLLTL